MSKCIQCGGINDRKGVYCSKSCNDKAYRMRKKGGTGAAPLVKDLKLDSVRGTPALLFRK